jgi:hypothetical protein
MSTKKRPAIIAWWPAIAIGAAIAELIYFSTMFSGLSAWSWYVFLVVLPLGGMLGYSTLRGVYGVYKALLAGQWMRILFLTIYSAIICIAICILAKYYTPHEFPAILPKNIWAACLIWAAMGVALTLIGLGEDYLGVGARRSERSDQSG